MTRILILASLFLLTISAQRCGADKQEGKVYKARLEIKGICSNYTFSLVQGNIDTSLIVSEWTDGVTGKMYKNVFAAADPCSLPDSLQQGDEFYFVIDTTPPPPCAVCMAYYPKPPRSLIFKTVSK